MTLAMAMLAGVAVAAGALGTRLARGLAWRTGIVNHPNAIVPQHVRTVAYLGGLGIALGFGVAAAVAAAAALPLWSIAAAHERGFAVGAIGFLLLGSWDDVRPFRPGPKLLAQLAVAVAAAAVALPDAGPAPIALATLWLVAVVNAVNLTDVCDGLVGSLAAVALIGVALAAPASAPLALVAAAATGGFLLLNRAPATIFLGDGGSHLLGFAVAALWLSAIAAQPSWHRAGAALVDIGVFALELGFLIVVRTRRGLPFWRGSPDHLALRLQAAGLGKDQTVAVALVPAVALAGVAVWLARAPGPAPVAVALLLIAGLGLATWRLYCREPVP